MRIVVLVLLVVLPVFAYAKNVTIVDMIGRSVDIPKSPKRIICLSPGTLRLISYLQATNLVVGIEELEIKNKMGRPYWLANQMLKDLPVISPGGPAGINKIPELETLLKVKPDLVFVTLLQKSKASRFQEKIGIPVVVLSYGRFASFDKVIFDSLKLAGTILGKNRRAEAVVQYVKGIERDLKSKVANITKRPTAYIGGIGFKGGQGIESTDSTYIPFVWTNTNNVSKQIKQSGHHFINKEMLLSLNPEHVFIDGGGKRQVLADYRRKQKYYIALDAFKNHKVYNLFPFNWYTTNVGSAIIDAYAIGKILYPTEFQDVVLKKKAGEIYRFLVGKNVFPIMERDYGKLGRLVLK